MRRRTRFLIILLAVFAILLATFVLWHRLAGKDSAETAVAVQMMKTEGTVTVTNNSARELKVMENMRLYNGYFVSTDEESYAWVNLDDTKLAKLDAVSRMELRKDGKKLQILVHEGNFFFNVTEPLEDEENMDICTATMVAGIRGTCGWVRKIDSMNMELCILEGNTQCTIINPVTGEQKSSMVSSGNIARFWWNEEEGTCGIDIRKAEQEDIPGFALKEIAEDTELKEKILDLSGMDLRNLTSEEAQVRLEKDQADASLQLEQIAVMDGGTLVISKDPVWKVVSDDNSGETEPNTEKITEPETELAAELETEPETEPTTESETEPNTEKITEPETEPTTESETEPNTEKITEPETEPTTESETEPNTEKITESETEPTTESETEPNTEKITEPETEPATESETEPITEKVTEPVTEPATEPEPETEPETYMVTYMLDGVQMGEVETYEYGAIVTVREKAMKEGYTVTDWNRTGSFTMPAENIVITATSMINTYTITFNANGGTLTGSETVNADYNTTVTLPEPIRTGYNFRGWFTEAENGTQFTADTVVTNGCALYAHWTAAEAKIMFDANGGSGEPTGIIGVTDESISDMFPESGVPTRQGYVFAGWYQNKDGSGEEVSAYPAIFPAGITTYYAKWDYIAGDFIVAGGIPGTDYSYSDTDRVLTILTGTAVSISGATTEDTIVVASGIEANVTLSGVSIDQSEAYDKPSPFKIPDGASATIILEGSNILIAERNSALEKTGTDGFLTIKGSGSLEAVGSGAGIGAKDGDAGNITIESGTIKAVGSGASAGIGGGYLGNGSNIKILGGNVTAIGGYSAAGIGGGGNTDGGDGSDPYGRGINITISGGVVTATGGEYGGAGIGGGLYGGWGVDISITGGVVIAAGGDNAAGIGGGANPGDSTAKGGNGDNIFITGGVVKATAGGTASCIGGGVGSGYNGESNNINLTSGIIFQGTSGQVYGEVTLDSDLEIEAGETLHIPSGSKLIISDGVTLTNNGTITYEASAQEDAVSGNLVNNGNVQLSSLSNNYDDSG